MSVGFDHRFTKQTNDEEQYILEERELALDLPSDEVGLRILEKDAISRPDSIPNSRKHSNRPSFTNLALHSTQIRNTSPTEVRFTEISPSKSLQSERFVLENPQFTKKEACCGIYRCRCTYCGWMGNTKSKIQ